MGFRSHNRDPETVWRRNSKDELVAAGVPDFIVDDENRWNYLLLHGDDPESGWRPEWITTAQAVALLRLLDAHYENRGGLDLLFAVRKTIDERPRA